MGAAVQGVEQVGCGCPDLGENLRGGGSGGHNVRVGDLGDDIAYWGGGGLGVLHHRVAHRLTG